MRSVDTADLYTTDPLPAVIPVPTTAANWHHTGEQTGKALLRRLSRDEYSGLSDGRRQHWLSARRRQQETQLRVPELWRKLAWKDAEGISRDLLSAMNNRGSNRITVLTGDPGNGRTQFALALLRQLAAAWHRDDVDGVHHNIDIPVVTLQATAKTARDLKRDGCVFLNENVNTTRSSHGRIFATGLRNSQTGILFVDDIDRCGEDARGGPDDIRKVLSFLTQVQEATGVAVLVTEQRTSPIRGRPLEEVAIAPHRLIRHKLPPFAKKDGVERYVAALIYMADQYALLDEPADPAKTSITDLFDYVYDLTEGNLTRTRRLLRWVATRDEWQGGRGTQRWENRLPLSRRDEREFPL